ncbi:MAG: peptide chain release factor N(5)-glutamine methyltransferase [Candidatus Aminicenantes bacterium]|nr:peptide chain release factor N(5)-glutamine methyltransferase [Candidatus Aminicenantes bacterium]
MTTLRELLRRGRSLLEGKVAAPAIEAKILLLEAVRIGEVEWLASPRRRIARREESRYQRLIERRLSGVPLAYITGKKEFWSLTLRVGPGVLIPRPETELIVERVLELDGSGRRTSPTIVDIGTGSGNIALTLAKELPRARIVATDVSAKALRHAERNARENRLTNVTFVRGSLFDALRGLGLEGKCDFIVSNPPYVSSSEWETLPAEIRDNEPRRALVGGRTGLEFIGRLVRSAPAFLKPGGWLLFEVGAGQAGKVVALLEQNALARYYSEARSFSDLRGIRRVIQSRKNELGDVPKFRGVSRGGG